jgi:hypothetical protein
MLLIDNAHANYMYGMGGFFWFELDKLQNGRPGQKDKFILALLFMPIYYL